MYNILSLLHELTHKQKYVMPTPKPAEDINKKEESRLVEITEEDEEEEEEEVEVEKAKEEEQNGKREEANVTKQENSSKAGQLFNIIMMILLYELKFSRWFYFREFRESNPRENFHFNLCLFIVMTTSAKSRN